jgi:hypothetical protein
MENQMVNRNIGIDFLRGISIVYIVGSWHMLNYTKAIPNYNNKHYWKLKLAFKSY